MSALLAHMVAESGHQVLFNSTAQMLVAKPDWSTTISLGFQSTGQAYGTPGSPYNAGTNTGYSGPSYWGPRNAMNATTSGLYKVRYIITSIDQPDGAVNNPTWGSVGEGGGVGGPGVGVYSSYKLMNLQPYIILAPLSGRRAKVVGTFEFYHADTSVFATNKEFTLQIGMT